MATSTKAVPEAAAGSACPACGFSLVSERGAAAWCERCEWNLNRFEPARRRRELGWTWQDRLTFRAAYRLNARQFTRLAGRTVDRPGLSWSRMFVVAVSLLMLAFMLGLFALGVYIIVAVFPGYRMVFGVLFVLLAIVLRPRFGRLDPYAEVITRTQAPTLFRLIDEVAAAIGTRAPATLLVNSRFNAYSTAYGIRRRRVLCVGLPLWAAVPLQQRVALLGHELGHFVNGDVRRAPLSSLAFSTLATLRNLTIPERGRIRNAGTAGFGEFVARGVMKVLHEFFAWAQILVTSVALRSTQRAEYFADQAAAKVGGTEAAIGLCDTLVLQEILTIVVQRSARQDAVPGAWVQPANQTRQELAGRMARLRQLTVRDDASLFRTHPPSGLRAKMLESRPYQSPLVVLSAADGVRIDEELAKPYRTARHDLTAG